MCMIFLEKHYVELQRYLSFITDFGRRVHRIGGNCQLKQGEESLSGKCAQ